METDNHKTDVIFLKDSEGDIFAYFLNDLYDNYRPHLRNSYQHIGQHSACHADYAKKCKEALPEEYNDLKEELESIGYNVNVVSKNILRKKLKTT